MHQAVYTHHLYLPITLTFLSGETEATNSQGMAERGFL